MKKKEEKRKEIHVNISQSEDKTGLPLVRAPVDNKKVSSESVDIHHFSHLVFVVHGIGQRMEEFNFLDDVPPPFFLLFLTLGSRAYFCFS